MERTGMSLFKEPQDQQLDADDIWFDPSRGQRMLLQLVLDTSSSMDGAPIRLLNEALAELAEHLRTDVQMSSIAHVSIITFGHDGVTAWRGRERAPAGTSPFVPAGQLQVPELTAGGVTPMVEAVELAMDCVAREKAMLKDGGLGYYCPLIWLISDGIPTDRDGRMATNWQLLPAKIKHGEDAHRYTFFTVSAGDISPQGDAVLKALAPTGHLRLRGFEFSEVLKLVSSSAERLARGDSMANIKRRIFEQIPA